MMWKIQQAMQDDAIRAARIHPTVHPGNRDEVFIWQNFQPAYRDLGWKKPRSREPSQPALSYEHIENFTKDLEVRRDLGNRASPVDRAGSVTGMNFALGSYEKFQPGFRDEKRSKILGTSSGAKFRKQSKPSETQKF